ncbi:MAG TPA: tetratricopeptide repeat protein [Humisphaera sp.]
MATRPSGEANAALVADAGATGSAEAAALRGAPADAAASVSISSAPISIPPSPSRFGRLWQFPLLIVSLGLFGYAAYRFIDPKPGPTIDERLATADTLLTNDRAEAATEVLRGLLAEDPAKLQPPQSALVHLYLARAIEQVQRSRKLDVADNYKRIIQHSAAAEKAGQHLDAAAHRRVAESYEALGKPGEAVDAYRKAVAADPEKALSLQRKVIELLVGRGEHDAAETALVGYLSDRRLSGGERAWGLGERSRILADRGRFGDASSLLDEAIRTEKDPLLLGELHYRLGYCQYRLGNPGEAERYLRLARGQLRASHPHDADAALLLGKILQAAGKHKEAVSFFQDVIVNYPDVPGALAAKAGRGTSRIAVGDDDAGLTDLTDAAREVSDRPSRNKQKPEVLAALRAGSKQLDDRGNLGGALELLALEQTLEETPTAEFFGRLSRLYERRAAQVEQAAAALADGPEKVKRAQQARALLTKAGDAAVAYSRGLTVRDDAGYAQALWRGVELYDRAGDLPRVIEALEVFIAERPEDPLTPEALLRLGKAFHASGKFDKAIEAFQRNQFRYGNTLAASKSGVPLALSFVAKGPASYPKAEAALKATLENPLLTPDAEEFRQAIYELAQLYYRTGRYEEAGQRLDELTKRYPQDERTTQVLYLTADSLRKSAQLLKAELKPAPADPTAAAQQIARQAEVTAAYRDRLSSAKRLYDQVIDSYRAAAPRTDLDRLYLKLSHFYRADCLYDVGQYDEAIRLYDAAALRYQDDPSALAGYVQIVNAYAALNRPEDARSANERLRWLLQRMPPESFKELQRSMPQQAWDDWVKWSKTAGLW